MKALFYVLLISSIFFTACGNYNILEKNLYLSKGMKKSNFDLLNIESKGILNLPNLTSKSKNKYELIVTKVKDAYSYTASPYYYAFCNDSLVYWGYPYKFTRNENQIIREIGEEAMQPTIDLFKIEVKK